VKNVIPIKKTQYLSYYLGRLLPQQEYDASIPYYKEELFPDITTDHIHTIGRFSSYIVDWHSGIIYIQPAPWLRQLLEKDKAGQAYRHQSLLERLCENPETICHFYRKWFDFVQNKTDQKYHISFDFFLRHIDDHQYRILQQILEIVRAENGAILYERGIWTDVSPFRGKSPLSLSIVAENGQEVLMVNPSEEKKKSQPDISKRELQILELIGKGYSSEEITDLLCISKKTLYTHRRNLLRKTGCRNMAEVVYNQAKI
jgi:DNA-binding CsgD family transcriptional regulator